MTNTIAQFDDELQAIAGTLTDATDLTPGGRRLLNRAADQVPGTKARIYLWPTIRSRIDIDGGWAVPGGARRGGGNAARAPRAGARATSGGYGQERELTGRRCPAGGDAGRG